MMQIITSIGQSNMRHRMLNLLIIINTLLLLLFLAPSAMANYIYLKPGQSKTIDSNASIDTVFVSNPAVADYKILSEKRVVIYAKTNGLSEITLYGNDTKVLAKVTVDVDPIISDLTYRIKSAFPNTDVRIQRLTQTTTNGKSVYLLTGQIPDEETGDLIYSIVGETVGTEKKEIELKLYTPDGGTNEIPLEHMTKYVYRNIIKRFTLPRQKANQVNVQMVIVEVSKEFTDAIGVEWSQIALDPNGSASTFGSQGHFQLINFHGFDAQRLVHTVNALKNENLAKVLANPNLTVLSGEVAEFLVGGEVPITIRDSTNNSVSTSYKAHGIMLSIAPKVLQDNKIKLTLTSELSSASDVSASDTSSPTFKTRRSTSTIELANGQSFVMGGLLKEEDIEILDKIPILGDIPILGALARNAKTKRQKTELVLFVTVNLVSPVDSLSEIDIPSTGNKTSSTKLLFNVGINNAARENRLLGSKNKQIDSKTVSFLDRGGFDK